MRVFRAEGITTESMEGQSDKHKHKQQHKRNSAERSKLSMLYKLVSSNQLFAVLIRLQRGLESLDVCTRFKISETTYSRMFSTWILFLSKELQALFPTASDTMDASMF